MTVWLADKSALSRIDESLEPAEWSSRIDRGLIRVTSLTRLEVGYSAQSADVLQMLSTTPPITLMPIEYLTPQIEDRAIEVQLILAGRGHHRAPSVPDLLIAAAAELGKLTILHVDKDFDLIAAVTGQPVERLQLRSKT